MASTRAGARRHLVTLQGPDGPPLPDGDGSYTQPVTYLSPRTLYMSVVPATGNNLGRVTERSGPGTVAPSATHIATGPFHPEVTTQTQLSWSDPLGGAHAANVVGIDNPDGACIQMVLVVVEVVS